MNLTFMKCGVIALGCLALSFGQTNADLVIDTVTKGIGTTATSSVNLEGVLNAGTVTSALSSGTPGTDSSITVTHTVSGLDLSAEEAGATSVSFTFDVIYSANNMDAVSFQATGGNVGIGNTQTGGTEVLTVAVSAPTNIVGFGGTISLDGIISARLANFNNDPDQQNLLLSDGSNIVLVGASDAGTPPAGSIAGDTATIAAALGITDLQQSSVPKATDPVTYSGSAGFRTVGTQFTASAGTVMTLLGDVNLDGVVDFLDIAPFIALLSAGGFQAEADCDENGSVDFLDIAPFIAILSAQ